MRIRQGAENLEGCLRAVVIPPASSPLFASTVVAESGWWSDWHTVVAEERRLYIDMKIDDSDHCEKRLKTVPGTIRGAQVAGPVMLGMARTGRGEESEDCKPNVHHALPCGATGIRDCA